jgi:hypothetical protein
MHVPLTLAALAALTTALLLLRIFWPRVPMRTQRVLTALAGVILILCAVTSATRWNPISPTLQALARWAAFASYEFFILLFTLFRPKRLTIPIAAVLILPILSASTLLPLGELFDSFPHATVRLDDHLFAVKTIIDRRSVAANATDLGVFYRTPFLPLLQRRVAATRFFDTQCNASASFAKIDPDRTSVILNCPASPTEPSGAPVVERHPIHR